MNGNDLTGSRVCKMGGHCLYHLPVGELTRQDFCWKCGVHKSEDEMNVQELIEQLQKIEDKSKTVLVSVHTNTQRFPVAYANIERMSGYFQQTDKEVRLFVWLPEGMHTVAKKIK